MKSYGVPPFSFAIQVSVGIANYTFNLLICTTDFFLVACTRLLISYSSIIVLGIDKT